MSAFLKTPKEAFMYGPFHYGSLPHNLKGLMPGSIHVRNKPICCISAFLYTIYVKTKRHLGHNIPSKMSK